MILFKRATHIDLSLESNAIQYIKIEVKTNDKRHNTTNPRKV